MILSLEDDFTDILSKAQAGWQISLSELAATTGLEKAKIQAVKKGEVDEATIRKLCPLLKLDAASLLTLARGDWQPKAQKVTGLTCYNTPFPLTYYPEMRVNAYLVSDPHSKVAAAFDSGADASGMLATLDQQALQLQSVFLTHTHPDHIPEIPALLAVAQEKKAYLHANESHPQATPIEDGAQFKIGQLTVTALLTNGHSPGGITYFIEGLEQPLAIVGDAIFAGSIGGATQDWENALTQIRKKILTLPDATILCPGHGPLTTVREQKQINPFFASSF